MYIISIIHLSCWISKPTWPSESPPCTPAARGNGQAGPHPGPPQPAVSRDCVPWHGEGTDQLVVVFCCISNKY